MVRGKSGYMPMPNTFTLMRISRANVMSIGHRYLWIEFARRTLLSRFISSFDNPEGLWFRFNTSQSRCALVRDRAD